MFKKENSMSIKRRKGNRRGFAGDDVTDNKAYAEEVLPQEDDSYVVKGTDSPDEIEVESETIDDQHNLVTDTDEGTEEEFLAESEEGDAEVIEEDGESREGHRKGHRRGIRRGSRKGNTFVDGKSPMDYMKMLFELQGLNDQKLIIQSGDENAAEEYMRKDAEFDHMSYEEYVRYLVEELKELEDMDDDYLGGRKGIRHGRRRGGSDEDELEEDLEELEEDTEELKEDREGLRRGSRKGIRRGSRKGETMDWDGIDYEAIAGKLEQLGEDPWGLDFDDLFYLAESKGLTPDQFEREGRKVSRRGVRRGDTVEVITDEEGNTEDVDLPEPDEREGRRRGRKVARRGSRKGSVYGGRSPEHQESIRSAVSVALKDRRL